MKIISFLIVTLTLVVSQLYAQIPEPTETMAQVTVIIHETGKPPAVGETVIFKSQKTGKEWIVTTGSDAKAVLLLAEGDIYDISYKDFIMKMDYAMMEIPNEPGLLYFDVEVEYEPAKVFKLENVYFDFAKASLRPESFPALDELVALLKARPSMVIEIAGHTDNVGDDASNMTLSQNRAESVRKYLISKGIAATRVQAKGYGETQPVDSNETEDGRQNNRRTEVRILSE